MQHFQENLDTNSFQICFDTESFAHAINLPFYPLLGAEIICYLNYSANFTSIQTVHKWMIHLHFGHNFGHNFGHICSNLSFIGIKCEICWWMFLLNLGFKMLKMILPFEPENGYKHIFLSSDKLKWMSHICSNFPVEIQTSKVRNVRLRCVVLYLHIQWYCYSVWNVAHSVCKFAHSVNFCTKYTLSSLWAMSHFGVKIVQASKPHCLFCCTSLFYTNWLGDALIWFCVTFFAFWINY